MSDVVLAGMDGQQPTLPWLFSLLIQFPPTSL